MVLTIYESINLSSCFITTLIQWCVFTANNSLSVEFLVNFHKKAYIFIVLKGRKTPENVLFLALFLLLPKERICPA